MDIIIYSGFGLLLLFHGLKAPNSWKLRFPEAKPGSEFEEIVMKSQNDDDFRKFVIGSTAKSAQFISAFTVFLLFLFFSHSSLIGKILCLMLSLVEIFNIFLSEHIVSISITNASKLKPFWLIVFGRLRNTTAISTVIILTYITLQ